jgi:hypothetical protein
MTPFALHRNADQRLFRSNTLQRGMKTKRPSQHFQLALLRDSLLPASRSGASM